MTRKWLITSLNTVKQSEEFDFMSWGVLLLVMLLEMLGGPKGPPLVTVQAQ